MKQYEYFTVFKFKENKAHFIDFCDQKLEYDIFFTKVLNFLGSKGWELISTNTLTEGIFNVENGDGFGKVKTSKEKLFFKREKNKKTNIEITDKETFLINEIYQDYLLWKDKEIKREQSLISILKNEKKYFQDLLYKYNFQYESENLFSIIIEKNIKYLFFIKSSKKKCYTYYFKYNRDNKNYYFTLYKKKREILSIIEKIQISFDDIIENKNILEEEIQTIKGRINAT
jgi:hypothetical protein